MIPQVKTISNENTKGTPLLLTIVNGATLQLCSSNIVDSEDRGSVGVRRCLTMEVDPTSASDQQLQRQLGLRDLVLSQILCVVGTMWVGVAAGLGKAQTLMWLGAMLVFYVPMAGSVIALNRAMPLEGGLYVWAHKAFGNLGGFLTAWNLWFYGIAVTASILYGIPSELAYLVGPRAAWLPESRLVSIAIVTALIVLLTAAELRGLEIGKWIHNVGAVAIMAVFIALIGLGPWAVIRHVPVHWTPLSFQIPPHDLRTLALFGQMMFGALCGLEYIAILAGESKSPERTIARSVWIASPIICLMFILGTGTVVAFVSRDQINFIAPIPQTLRIALGNEGLGNLFAITAILLLQMRLLGAVSYLMTGVSRLPLAVGWNDMIPAWFTRLHPRWKTPTNSILCTSALLFVMSFSPRRECTRRRPSKCSPMQASRTTKSHILSCSPFRCLAWPGCERRFHAG
jgi:glutamate:GABA antiporter